MSKIIADSRNFLSQVPGLLHNGPGSVLRILASHAESSAQTVILYDGLNAASPIMLKLHLPTGSIPFHLQFPEASPLRFALGLYVDPGNCAVHLTTIGG